MPDICDLILDDHETFRRRFAELDERAESDAKVLAGIWDDLSARLDVHAEAEEAILYPELLRRGEDEPEEETEDAVRDHDKIKEAVAEAAKHKAGSTQWWEAVGQARQENGEHMAEEEDGPLSDFRRSTDKALRERLGADFLRFQTEHAGRRDLDVTLKDPEEFVQANS